MDDKGLMEFHRDSYPFPLYKDEDLVFYNEFFGMRKLGLRTYNPFRLYKGYKEMSQRLADKKLEGNMVGEGMVLGGIIIFGKDGNAKFAYQEETGREIPVDDILAAVDSIISDANEL